ncbi:hypothetical protein [Sphingopyxis sp. KK2]|uniref:hypothetical protein n=1 Tax=Sphingopyxis sp. KK2 TaxID=1855727 RepID=UPI00097E7005|nr:hypothetical protein [Sphingopyxis sp. KK2]
MAGAASPNDSGSLQAFGDAPLWTVVVDASRMSVTIEEDGEPVFRELPAPAVSGAGKERIFRTKTASGAPVELRITKAPCATAAEELEMQALLIVGPARREGCALALDAADALPSRPLLGDLALDARIVSKGGPRGFELDIQDSGTRLAIGGREFTMGKPIAVQTENAPWPTIANNTATYALASEDETVTASALVEAVACKADGKTYPLALKLVFKGTTYRSCASQAYQTLSLPTDFPPVLAVPER